MSRLKPSSLALRDQLLAALRSEPERVFRTMDLLRSVDPHGRTTYYAAVYNHCRAMTRSGLVIWHDWMGWECGCPPASTIPGAAAHYQSAGFQAAPYDEETGITLADLEALVADDAE